MASINQVGGVPAINNIPQGYVPYYNAPNYYNVPNYNLAPNNGYQRSPYENYHQLGQVIDMIKDLSEAIYYCTTAKAMTDEAWEKKEPQKETMNESK